MPYLQSPFVYWYASFLEIDKVRDVIARREPVRHMSRRLPVMRHMRSADATIEMICNSIDLSNAMLSVGMDGHADKHIRSLRLSNPRSLCRMLRSGEALSFADFGTWL